MSKKILFIFIFGVFFATAVHAKTLTVKLRVTMPQVVRMDSSTMQDEDEQDRQGGHNTQEIVIVEETLRQGQTVIVKSIVTK